MIYYRLLRDNKETGPYSEEEMIAKGFKPYDLLWAEGKSAGWQYPSEINAFKKYAPIVEEQPFDRFYKKQPAQQTAAANEQPKPSYTPVPRPAEPAYNKPQQPVERPVYEYHVQDLPARHIHVALPSGNTVNLTALAKKDKDPKDKELKDAVRYSNTAVAEPVAVQTDRAVPKTQPSFAESIYTPDKPATVRVAAIDPAPNKPEPAGRGEQTSAYNAYRTDFSWSLVLGGIIGIMALVGLGIMIGLSLNREKANAAASAAFTANTRQQKPSSAEPKTSIPVQTVTPVPVPVAAVTAAQHTAAPVRKVTASQTALVKNTSSPTNAVLQEEKKPEAAINLPTENIRTAQHRDDPVQHAKPLTGLSSANIERSLSISTNEFKTGAFGGISSLKCTLFNGSKLPLESVEVEVNYIQANNKVYKTEKLVFKDIAGGAQATVDAPSSTRGVKITSRIIKVNAREALSNITARS